LTPVLNEAEYIGATVKRMQQQRFDGTIEFLFMDGRSDDATREILKTFANDDPRIRVLDNPARHTAAGLNVGLREARGRYVARMDAHTFYPPAYLQIGVDRLRRGGATWVCGPQVPRGMGPWSERVALALSSRLGVGGSHRFGANPGQESELDTGVFTGVWARETLAAFGGWDEGWPINQDSELAARMLMAGHRVVSLPEMAADYVPRNSLRRLARQYRRYGFYRAKTAAAHPQSVRPSMVLAPGVVAAGAASILPWRLLARAGRAGLGAYMAAVVSTAYRLARGKPGETLRFIAIFLSLHLPWGAGFIAGTARHALRRPTPRPGLPSGPGGGTG
jgi:glycosyltransferase involved in cell wall biosynthesis